ncbi:MAG: S8 family serine peptidase, partial [Planctomycetota bacterium]|nr:S8 family serine peptidase [Planctomycetota bacterium]
ENYSSDSLIAAELLERRYAFTATPLFDEFTSAAMEAVARGELTSERWIVHKLSDHELSIEGSHQSLTNFGGNAGWNANPIGKSFFRLETSGIDSSDIVEWARNHQDRFLVEPDLPIQVEATSNDPSLWRLYGLNNYGQSGGTTDADIDAPEAWDITTGSRDVVIGVIDSGVDVTHPDLAANIWVNPGETPNNGIDDDGNGFIDDVNGWDFYDDDNTPNDGNGHGTHVAGTIGAVGNNNLGITGVNWEVSLLPLRFLGNDGSGWTSDAVAAVNYATMLKRYFGINVVATNNSWGGGGYSRTLDRAIEAANDEGIMFVAAAGNEGNNNDTNPRYPTNYDAPNVISVAALNRNDNLAGFSNYGATTVDVGAPGVSIYSTLPGNSYGSFSGTSMAAPHVAGVVGLLNAAKPGISVTEVSNAILGTVDTLQSLNGKTVSGGRVNAAAALTSILGQVPTIDPFDNIIMNSGQTKDVAVSASDIDGDVSLEFSLSDFSGETAPATVDLTGSTLAITAISGRSGRFTIQVTARDVDSNTATESFQVEVLNEIESNGSVTLSRDTTGKLFANEFAIRDSAGNHIPTTQHAGWQTLAVENIDGVNTVLWEYTATGRLHYWHTDASWNWQSSFGKHFDGSTEYYTAETQFEIDINQDGVLGKPEPAPEPEPKPAPAPAPEPEP